MQHACDHQGYGQTRVALLGTSLDQRVFQSQILERLKADALCTHAAGMLRVLKGVHVHRHDAVRLTLRLRVCTYAACAQLRDNGFGRVLQVGIEHERRLPLQQILYVQHQGAPLLTGRVKVDAQVQQGRLAHLPADAVAAYQAVAVSRFTFLCVGLGRPYVHGVCRSMPALI